MSMDKPVKKPNPMTPEERAAFRAKYPTLEARRAARTKMRADAAAKPAVRMSPERRAAWEKEYPTPELRAKARARIKAKKAATAATGTPTVTSTVNNVTSNSAPSAGKSRLADIEAMLNTDMAAMKKRATKTSSTSRTLQGPEKAAVLAKVRKAIGGRGY